MCAWRGLGAAQHPARKVAQPWNRVASAWSECVRPYDGPTGCMLLYSCKGFERKSAHVSCARCLYAALSLSQAAPVAPELACSMEMVCPESLVERSCRPTTLPTIGNALSDACGGPAMAHVVVQTVTVAHRGAHYRQQTRLWTSAPSRSGYARALSLSGPTDM